MCYFQDGVHHCCQYITIAISSAQSRIMRSKKNAISRCFMKCMCCSIILLEHNPVVCPAMQQCLEHLAPVVRILPYFTLVGIVSSDVSRSSCTTSFTPCCSIFSQSYVFFQGCPFPLIYVIDVGRPSSFPRHHSENACLY